MAFDTVKEALDDAIARHNDDERPLVWMLEITRGDRVANPLVTVASIIRCAADEEPYTYDEFLSRLEAHVELAWPVE